MSMSGPALCRDERKMGGEKQALKAACRLLVVAAAIDPSGDQSTSRFWTLLIFPAPFGHSIARITPYIFSNELSENRTFGSSPSFYAEKEGQVDVRHLGMTCSTC